MPFFGRKSSEEVLREGTQEWLAAHKARKEGRTADAEQHMGRYVETEREINRRYADEDKDPKAAVLLRRAFGRNY